MVQKVGSEKTFITNRFEKFKYHLRHEVKMDIAFLPLMLAIEAAKMAVEGLDDNPILFMTTEKPAINELVITLASFDSLTLVVNTKTHHIEPIQSKLNRSVYERHNYVPKGDFQ